MRIVQKYINMYLHKITTQNALWQRYTSSQVFLGEVKHGADMVLACAVIKKSDIYATKS